ncbi:MAG: DASS family sodium-coupled anion symporter [Candidatus Latescibacterota bacterium]|nr:MAG: DASS family sodium-coupled anion symporter [Candidatus Latescibacterota bacterium]
MSARRQLNRSAVQWTGLWTGPLLALIVYYLLPDTYVASDGATVEFTHAGRITAAVAVWMATWWMTEAIPIYATSLLPLAVLPFFRATTVRQAAAPYAHELIYLFLGGFVIALSMERWGLHKRFAFGALRLVGTRPHRVVLGFMIATAFMSMWVSNTATTIMMLPIALSVIDLVSRRTVGADVGALKSLPSGEGYNFALGLLLGIAYAASIGGIGTLIGTPPNLFLASYIKDNLGREISFVGWMGIGLPLVVVFLPIVWYLITRVLYPIKIDEVEGGGELIRRGYRELGGMKRGEWVTLFVFAFAAMSWILRPLLSKIVIAGLRPFGGLTDPGIAVIAALLLFVIPVDIKKREFAMNWETAVKLPWGILVLFGGGLSLAAAIRANGVGEFIGHQVAGFSGLPVVAIVLLVTAIMIYLTELTSNTATAATLIPILAAIAPGLDMSPYVLIVPAAIAASCAFMLPVATPPNAIIFGSGYVRIDQMVRAGFWLNLIGILLVTIVTFAVVVPILAR